MIDNTRNLIWTHVLHPLTEGIRYSTYEWSKYDSLVNPLNMMDRALRRGISDEIIERRIMPWQ